MVTKCIGKPDKNTNDQVSENQCAHHWIIDPPDSRVSMGNCKKCGEVREFKNWIVMGE